MRRAMIEVIKRWYLQGQVDVEIVTIGDNITPEEDNLINEADEIMSENATLYYQLAKLIDTNQATEAEFNSAAIDLGVEFEAICHSFELCVEHNNRLPY